LGRIFGSLQGSARNAATHENGVNSSSIEGRTAVQASKSAPRNEAEKDVETRMYELRIFEALGLDLGIFLARCCTAVRPSIELLFTPFSWVAAFLAEPCKLPKMRPKIN
jgi:hypothetical protein